MYAVRTRCTLWGSALAEALVRELLVRSHRVEQREARALVVRVQQRTAVALHAPHARERCKERLVDVALAQHVRVLGAQLVVLEKVCDDVLLAARRRELGGERVAAREQRGRCGAAAGDGRRDGVAAAREALELLLGCLEVLQTRRLSAAQPRCPAYALHGDAPAAYTGNTASGMTGALKWTKVLTFTNAWAPVRKSLLTATRCCSTLAFRLRLF
jgi:hypothetical protein